MNKAMREQIISFLSEVATFAMEQQNVTMAKEAVSLQKRVMGGVGRTTYSQAEKDAITLRGKEMRAEGKSWIEIADILGVKHGTIFNWVEGRKGER